jgi:hypothetical protein
VEGFSVLAERKDAAVHGTRPYVVF